MPERRDKPRDNFTASRDRNRFTRLGTIEECF
jgi:hypothetical protein